MYQTKANHKIALLILCCLGLSDCTVAPKEMARLMRQEGISAYRETGYSPLSCGKDDAVSTGFVGTKNGQSVEGTVCGGLLFKAYTIRYK